MIIENIILFRKYNCILMGIKLFGFLKEGKKVEF